MHLRRLLALSATEFSFLLFFYHLSSAFWLSTACFSCLSVAPLNFGLFSDGLLCFASLRLLFLPRGLFSSNIDGRASSQRPMGSSGPAKQLMMNDGTSWGFGSSYSQSRVRTQACVFFIPFAVSLSLLFIYPRLLSDRDFFLFSFLILFFSLLWFTQAWVARLRLPGHERPGIIIITLGRAFDGGDLFIAPRYQEIWGSTTHHTGKRGKL